MQTTVLGRLKYKCWPVQRTCATKTKTGIAQIRGIQLLKYKHLPAKLTCTTKPRKKTQNKSANSEHVRFWRRQGLTGIGRNERMHTTVKQPCSSSTMNHATSWFERKTTELYSKRCSYEKKGSRSKAQQLQIFFLATHVSKVFGPNTAPIRPRYVPDNYAFFQKFNRQRLAFFQKSEIYKN